MNRAWFLAAASLLSLVTAAAAQAPPAPKSGPKPIEVKVPSRKQPVSYANDIADILDTKCTGCHSSVLAENKLTLEDVPGMLKGGKHGPAIIPGKAEESLLFRMAAHRTEPVMPPKDKPGNSPMTSEELGLLKLWIDAGAKDDSAEGEKPKQPKAIVLGELPPGVQPINAVDMTASGARVAAGRANVVQVYDVDSGLEIVSLGGHKDLIQSVRFSPDGKLLAAGSYQIVTLWTVPTGTLAKTLSGHGGPVLALAASSDGKRAYSGSQDSTVRAWDAAEGKTTWTSKLPVPVTALALAPDGKTLAAGGSDGSIRLIDPANGHERTQFKGHASAVEGLAILPAEGTSARLVSISADGTGRIWTVPQPPAAEPKEKKAEAKTAEPKSVVLSGHKGAVRALAVTPDWQTVITGGEDASVRLWNVKDGSPKGNLKTDHGGPVLALAVSPDGKLLATGSADKTARLVTLSDGKVVRILTSHTGPVHGLSFSPRGDRLATAGAEGGLKVWDTANGQGLIAFGHTAPKGGAIQPLRKVAFTAEGCLISASADTTLKTWTFAGAWAEQKTFGPHAFRVLALDFSPDGKLLAAGGGDPSRSGEIKIWEVGKGLLVRTLGSLHSDTVYALRFSPDGTKLASAASDKFLKVTAVADGKELRSFEGHTHHVMAVDWKSDGKQIITVGADNVLKVWDFESGEQVRTISASGKQVTAARWIAGKPEVAVASGDALVRTWNPDSSAVVRGFSGPSDYVYSVAASADGSRIAAGGADSVLFIWNGQNGQVLHKLMPPPARPAAGASLPPNSAR